MNDKNLVMWSNNVIMMVYSVLVGSSLLVGGLQGDLDYFHFFAFVLAMLFALIVSIIIDDMFGKPNIAILIITNVIFYVCCRYAILMLLFLSINVSGNDILDKVNSTVFTPNVNKIVKIY